MFCHFKFKFLLENAELVRALVKPQPVNSLLVQPDQIRMHFLNILPQNFRTPKSILLLITNSFLNFCQLLAHPHFNSLAFLVHLRLNPAN